MSSWVLDLYKNAQRCLEQANNCQGIFLSQKGMSVHWNLYQRQMKGKVFILDSRGKSLKLCRSDDGMKYDGLKT